MKHFTASDGAQIAYRDEGSGTAARAAARADGAWRLLPRAGPLAERVPADQRRPARPRRVAGTGRAPTVERLAADVAELAEALDLQDAIGIGWSLGATILWHVLAGPAAARFAGAVVVDMTARVLNDDEWDLGLSPEACEARSAAIRDDFQSFAAGAGQAIFAQPVARRARARSPTGRAPNSPRNDPAAIAALWALAGRAGRARRCSRGSASRP